MRGLGSGLPYAGLALIGLIGVTTAMTVLGFGDVPSVAPPSVSPSTTATSLAPTPSPTELDIYPTVTVPPNLPQLTTETVSRRGAGGHWKIDFRFPQFVAGSTPLAYLLNLDIKSEMEMRLDAYVTGSAIIPDPGGATNWLIGDYSVELLTPRVACLLLSWSDNSASKQRPFYGFQALNFDLTSARRMDLGEIFTDLPAALSIISAEARVRLRAVLGDEYDPDAVNSGTEPLAVNYTGWSLTREGLKITMSMYQVAGYRHGLPVVVIPWSKLAALVRAEGPAGEVARQALAAPSGSSALSGSSSPSAAPAG
jgi:hypothetical protein